MSEQLDALRRRRDRLSVCRELLAAHRLAALDAELLAVWSDMQHECKTLEAVERQIERLVGPKLTLIKGGKGKGKVPR